METLWFCLVAAMLASYVVFDGFDLGAGAIYLLVARGDAERRQVLRSIGPVWDGNEVWLLAAGGTLYFAFPSLYASSFSGFYLPLMIVLWLLMLRGISIEFRNHVAGSVWGPFWDAVFCASSTLLPVFFGAALGNVVRGVPLDTQGRFFEPLWTDFTTRPPTGILDWYTVLAGLSALAALAAHGALWIALKTSGQVSDRARRLARHAWWAVLVLTLLLTAATFHVQPHVPRQLTDEPWRLVFPALALGGLLAALRLTAAKKDRTAFLSSCTYLAGMLSSAAFGLYPYVLPANGDPSLGLTVHSTAADAYGLRVGLVWWIPGMALATGYVTCVYRRFAGKVDVTETGY